MLVYLFENNKLTGTIGETVMSTYNMSKPFNIKRIIGKKSNDNSSLLYKAKVNAPKEAERY